MERRPMRRDFQCTPPPSRYTVQHAAFRRRLLSQYDPDISLSNYIAFFELKEICRACRATPEKTPELSKLFLDKARESMDHVKSYAEKMDARLIAELRVLTRLSEEHHRQQQTESGYLFKLWQALRCLERYRALNREAVLNLLGKYQTEFVSEFPTTHNLVRSLANEASSCPFGLPPFDITRSMDTVTCVLAVVSGHSFEDAMLEMKVQEARKLSTHERIPPVTAAYYFREKSACVLPKGSFSVKLVCGSCGAAMTKMVSQVMKVTPTPTTIGRFANGEVTVRLQRAVRGGDCYIMQSLHRRGSLTLSSILMELLLLSQACMLASAGRVTAVLPFLAYTQRVTEICTISDFLVAMGVRNVITVDMFLASIDGIFEIPVDNISAREEFVRYLVQQMKAESRSMSEIVVVAASPEAVGPSRLFADSLMKHARLLGEPKDTLVGIATAVARNPSPHGAQDPEIAIAGHVTNMVCVIVDSVLNEGFNVTAIARELKSLKCKEVKAVITHALFSEGAVQRVKESVIDELIVSDSVVQDDLLKDPEMARKLRIISIAPLLAEAIERVHTGNSMTVIFDS